MPRCRIPHDPVDVVAAGEQGATALRLTLDRAHPEAWARKSNKRELGEVELGTGDPGEVVMVGFEVGCWGEAEGYCPGFGSSMGFVRPWMDHGMESCSESCGGEILVSPRNQAARAYRWWRPPTRGSATTLPSRGPSTARPVGASPSSAIWGRSSL
jgi:hypothetical protein